MKRWNLLLMLFVLVSAQQPVRASSSDGYGANAYAAGAIATAGLVGGGYKLMRNYKAYQANQAAQEAKKSAIALKIEKFDYISRKIQKNIKDQLDTTRNFVIDFLKKYNDVYDVCIEYKDKFEELLFKLKEMKSKIEQAHISKKYSESQGILLDRVTIMLYDVQSKHESVDKFAEGIAQNYSDILDVVEYNFAGCLVDDASKKSEKFKPVMELQDKASIDQNLIDLKMIYEKFVVRYEALMNEYNSQYGSYFTRLKGYFRYLFSKNKDNSKPLETIAASTSTSAQTAQAASGNNSTAVKDGSGWNDSPIPLNGQIPGPVNG